MTAGVDPNTFIAAAIIPAMSETDAGTITEGADVDAIQLLGR